MRKTRTAIAVRIARILYQRWEKLSPSERTPLEALARDVKTRALDLRGAADDGRAELELEHATTELAEALGADEIALLRRELREELDRAAARAA